MYFAETGWRRSLFENKVIDKDGNAIPWYTYSYIYFIEPRLKDTFDIFQFGCGASTEWYAKRCGQITSVENNPNWYDKMKDKENTTRIWNYC
jgi:hypothetical protein